MYVIPTKEPDLTERPHFHFSVPTQPSHVLQSENSRVCLYLSKWLATPTPHKGTAFARVGVHSAGPSPTSFTGSFATRFSCPTFKMRFTPQPDFYSWTPLPQHPLETGLGQPVKAQGSELKARPYPLEAASPSSAAGGS